LRRTVICNLKDAVGNAVTNAWHHARDPGCAAWRVDPHLHAPAVASGKRYVCPVGPRQSGFLVHPPPLAERLPVWIFTSGSVEHDRLAVRRCNLHGRCAGLPVHHQLGIVVGVGVVFDRPVHACGKIALIGLAPTPDRGLVGDMLLAIMSDNAILRRGAGEQIAALRPDRVRLAVGLAIA
jgi:hypothetical protein